MNKALILIVALLALAAGLYWWSASESSPQELRPSQPASNTSSTPGPSALSNEDSRSTNPSRESAPGAPLPNPASTNTNSQTQAATSSAAVVEPLEVPGSLPSVGTQPKAPRELQEYEQKYAQATAGELLSAYQALQDYYQMHFDGRIEDKNQRLSVEALEALAREIAWLKERAINGPGDG